MTTLKALRGDLDTVLEAAQIRTETHLPERVTPPLAIIGAGSPYVEPGDTFGTFAVRFTIFLVAARAANETATDELDAMVLKAVDAIMGAGGWGVARVDQPSMLEANGAHYLSTAMDVITQQRLEVDS